jgi:hypothetical protein
MNDENALREKARQAIQGGMLPNRSQDRMWGGPGAGSNCVICNESVNREELEVEIEYARDGDNPRVNTYHFHVRCFGAWEFERLHPDHRAFSSGMASGATGVRTLTDAVNDGIIRRDECGTTSEPGPR